MKMIKKMMALALALMMLLCLCACGEKSEEPRQTTAAPTESITAQGGFGERPASAE